MNTRKFFQTTVFTATLLFGLNFMALISVADEFDEFDVSTDEISMIKGELVTVDV